MTTLATLEIKGTQRKIKFLTDILCSSPPKWRYVTKSGQIATIKFKDIDDVKVMKAMFKHLQTRKDLKIF